MKKISKMIGIIAIAAIIGVSFAACDLGTKKDALHGTTWEATDGMRHYVLTFNSPMFTMTATSEGRTFSYSESYTISGNNVVFSNGEGESITAVLSGNTLTIVDDGSTVVFTKQ